MQDNLERIYELSTLQQGLLYESVSTSQRGLFIAQHYMQLANNLNVTAWQKSWIQLCEQHAILRTGFFWEKLDKPLQVVYKQITLPWTFEDLRTEDEPKARLSTFAAQDRAQGFDLKQAPLMRCTLFHMPDGHYHFVWSYHHIILDGWSIPLLLQEVSKRYIALTENQPLTLGAEPPYHSYIAWLQRQDNAPAEQFWRTELAGFTAPTPFYVDTLPKSAEPASEYGYHTASLSAQVKADLTRVAKEQGLTLNTIFQGVWALLLT